MSLLKNFISGTAWVFGTKIINVVSTFAFNAIIARLLPASDLGTFFLSFSLIQFLAIFALFGLDKSIVSAISYYSAIGQFASISRVIKKSIGILAVSGLFFASLVFLPSIQKLLTLKFELPLTGKLPIAIAFWLLLSIVQQFIVEAFRGFNNIKHASIFNGFIHVILSILFVLVANQLVDISLFQIICLFIAGLFINNFLALITFKKKHLNIRIDKTQNVALDKSIFWSSFKLFGVGILLFVLNQGHLWLLAYYENKTTVAAYGAVLKIMVLITSLYQMFRSVMMPMIGKLYYENKKDILESMLRKVATISSIVSLFSLVVVLIFSKLILFWTFGEFATIGSTALILLTVANFINVLSGTPGTVLIMAHKELVLLMVSFFCSVISIFISLFLVSIYGINGVAIGASFGLIIYNVVVIHFTKRLIKVKPYFSVRALLDLLNKETLKNILKRQLL